MKNLRNLTKNLGRKANKILKEQGWGQPRTEEQPAPIPKIFNNIAFPVVRRVFPSLVANDIVSVQPMSLPFGSLFYMEHVYGGLNKQLKKAGLKVVLRQTK
jgi:hypothetical protein